MTSAGTVAATTAAASLNDTLRAIHSYLSVPASLSEAGSMDVDEDHVGVDLPFSFTAGFDPAVTESDHALGIPAPRVLPATLDSRIWVTCWVDFTSKYGLGYMLSNGSVGVYFNDSTKVILASDGVTFEYVERTQHGRAPPTVDTEGCNIVRGSDGVYRVCATMSRYPSSLKKKVTLLRHFQLYLQEQYRKRVALTSAAAQPYGGATRGLPLPPTPTIMEADLPTAVPGSSLFSDTGVAANGGISVYVTPEEEAAMRVGSGTACLPYVKKWVRTRRGLLFRLSNHTLHAFLFDGSSMVISNRGRVVTHMTGTGYRTTYDTTSLLTAGDAAARVGAQHVPVYGMAKRLRYLRDVLTQLINAAPSGCDAGAGATVGGCE